MIQKKIGVLGLKRVGSSKISKNRRTSLMDVPYVEILIKTKTWAV